MNLYGLKESELKTVKAILEKHLKNQDRYIAWIYGSRARGDHKPHSDIDVLLQCSPAASDSGLASLRAEFEESRIPYKVDLVLEENLFPAYRADVERDRKLILEKV